MMENEYSAISTVEGEILPKTYLDEYPGQRRNTIYAPLPPDRVLVKTAGNALQAVPQEHMDQKNLIAVTVPGILKPGDEILVKAPSDGRIIRAEVPSGAVTGQVFFVHAPPPAQVAATGIPINTNAINAEPGSGGTQVVAGEDIENNDLILQEEGNGGSVAPFSECLGDTHQTTGNDPNLILVRVPQGLCPGATMRVKVPDGRTIEAVVPADSNVKEFYLRVPPKPQNWHDNPLALASAAATPYFV